MNDDDDLEEQPTPHPAPRRLTGPYPVVTAEQQYRHFAGYPPGTPVVMDATPTLHERVTSLEDSRRFWRRIAVVVLPLLLAGLGGLTLWSADKISTSSERVGATLARLDGVIDTVRDLQKSAGVIGGMEARIDALFKLLNMLEDDIRELRKHAGLVPHTFSIGTVGANP